jgi:hypothetical protein
MDYSFFYSQWNYYLDNSEKVFSSVNIYSVLRCFKEYYLALNKKKSTPKFSPLDLSLLEKLNEQLTDLPDFIILNRLNSTLSVHLKKEIESWIKGEKITMEDFDKINKYLKFIIEEEFLKGLIFALFINNYNDSDYLIKCLLRICLEKFSLDYLREIPKGIFFKYLIKINNNYIVEAISNDLEDFKIILNTSLLKTKIISVEKSINFEEYLIVSKGKWFSQFKSILSYVISFLIKNIIKYIEFENENIKFKYTFAKFSRTVEKYYLYYVIWYFVNHLHDAPHYGKLEINLKENIERHNLSFQKLLKMSQDKFLLRIETSGDVRFYSRFLIPLYRAILNFLLFVPPLHINEFEEDLKLIIEKNFKSDIKDWMHLTTFKKDLEEFFMNKFDTVLPLLLEKIYNIEIEIFTDVQIKNIAYVEISNRFLKFSFENVSTSLYNNLNIDNQFIDFFYKQLFSFKKKYRVFFILTGLEYYGEKIDFDDVKIYNKEWYFFESNVVEQQQFMENNIKINICSNRKMM